MKTRFSNLYIKNLYDFNDTIIIKNANIKKINDIEILLKELKKEVF